MWFLPLQVPLRYKLYGLVALAFVLGLLRWRNEAVRRAIQDLESRQREAAAEAARVKRGVEHEVELLDDVGLVERASRWVRSDDT